jgi:tetratricopeptide (TPR) repeat protein
MYTGDFGKARDCSLECLDLASRVDDQYAIAWATNNGAAVDAHLGYFDEAVVGLQRSIAANQRRGYLRGLAFAFHNLGGVYTGVGEFDVALTYLQRATEYSRQMGDPRLLHWHNVTRSEALLGLHDTELASAILHPAESSFAQAGMRYQEINALLQLGVCSRLQHEPEIARTYLSKALELSMHVGTELLSSLIYIQMALTEDAEGDRSMATTFATKAYRLLFKFGSTVSLDRRVDQFSSEVRVHLINLKTAGTPPPELG